MSRERISGRGPRFDFAPLAELLRLSIGEPKVGQDVGGDMLGVSRHQYRNWEKDGIPGWDADEVCIRAFGLAPSEVWPDWQERMDEWAAQRYEPARPEHEGTRAQRRRYGSTGGRCRCLHCMEANDRYLQSRREIA